MNVAFVESRPKKGKADIWEDVLLSQVEMLAAPQIGSIARIPNGDGVVYRYRIREVMYDVPGPASSGRVVDEQLTVFVVAMPSVGSMLCPVPAVQNTIFQLNEG